MIDVRPGNGFSGCLVGAILVGEHMDDIGDLAHALEEFSLVDCFERCRFGTNSDGGSVACDSLFPQRYVVCITAGVLNSV